MKALIVHESMYGNTHAVADAVAEGLGAQAEVDPCPVHAMPTVPADLDLLIVGGPTHLHGLSTALSRGMAVAAAKEDAGKVDRNSFVVADAEGPLEDGELERARAWGEALASDHRQPWPRRSLRPTR
jgi:flavorubredoxin